MRWGEMRRGEVRRGEASDDIARKSCPVVPLSQGEKLDLAGQQEFSNARRLYDALTNLTLTSLEVNVDKGKQNCQKLLEAIGASVQKMTNITEVTYSKEIYEWAVNFNNKMPKDLATGIHTLEKAAKVVSDSSKLKLKLQSYGGVKFLASVGKLFSWTTLNGETRVANLSWLLQCLNVLFTSSQGSEVNNGKDPVLGDATPVTTHELLKEEVAKRKLDWTQFEQVLTEFEELFVVRPHVVTPFNNLLPAPSMSAKIFYEFDKDSKEDGIHVSYSFALNENVTTGLLHRILLRCLQLHRPTHLWRNGAIINDSIVAVMVGHLAAQKEDEDYCNSKIINLSAYMMAPLSSDASDVGPNAFLLWSTIEKYRSVVLHALFEAGLVWEEICRASTEIFPAPKGVRNLTCTHSFTKGAPSSCMFCGLPMAQANMLHAMHSVLEPSFFNAEVVKSKEFEGFVQGSLLELSGPCHVKIKAVLDPLGSRKCSVTLVQGNVRLLKILFQSSKENSVCIDLANKKITSSMDGNTTSDPISDIFGTSTYGGVILTALLRGQESLFLDIYMGPKLLASVPVPFNKYHLAIDAKDLSAENNAATLTVHGNTFKGSDPVLATGMRLEALDRLTPNLVCVATILEIDEAADQILIHFDGWTDRYDYWTNFESADLHPLGYMYHNGKRLAKEKRKNSSLQPPNNYRKTFDWLTYLQEVGAPPVPFELFSEEQKEGTQETETSRVESGLSPDIVESSVGSCLRGAFKSLRIEQSAKTTLAKVETDMQKLDSLVTEVLGTDSKLWFCFFPENLSIDTLRFLEMKSIFSSKAQHVHFLCQGQAYDFHLVNHKGVKMSSADLLEWSPYLLYCYTVLLRQKVTVPSDVSALCPGAEALVKDKMFVLEQGMKRLYNLYLQHCVFITTNRSSKQKNPTPEQVGKITELLQTSLESASDGLGQQLSISQGTTEVMCQGHRMAFSQNSGIQELSIDKFNGLAPNIYSLHLESNPLTSLPGDLFDHFLNLTQLWLNGCKISELPSLGENSCLEELHVNNNQLSGFPDDIKQLSSLKILDVSSNPLEVLPKVVSSLTSLTKLLADNVGTVDLELVCPLTSLEKLSVSHNLIEFIPPKLSALPLTVFYMAGLPLMPSNFSFSAAGVNSFLDQYTVYRRLTTQERQEMIEKAENLGEKSGNSAKIANINQTLFDRYPRLGKMEKHKGTGIPEPIFQITTLQKLNLSYHAFTVVAEMVQELKNLENLNVMNNPLLESVSAEVAKLPLKEIHLRDCASLKTPPKEVVRRGFIAVFGYLKRLLQGSVPCKRTKLMMVGLGGAGKTSLVRALTNKSFRAYQDYGEQITDGIDITEWKISSKEVDLKGEVTDDSDEPLHFSVWDFAGQTVYYNTHQFFLSNRAVYLLLWNIRLGFEHAGLDFWLSSVACHAPKAPILVVGTHCDKVERGKLPMEELKRRFPQIVGFHFVSSYSGEGIKDLRNDLMVSALKQKYMGEKIPEAWLSLERKLDKLRADKDKALLPWEEVDQVANAAGIFDQSELVQAIQFLHDLGSVQFFNTNFLRSHVVIVPQWIVDVMACIVTVHEGPVKEGKLLYSDMKNVWSDYEESLHPWLLRLTEEFDLTFPLMSEEANVVPCLLPNTEPQYDFAALDKEKGEREARLIYKFDYLPAGLFNRAQTRLHQFSDSSVMWKKGFMLKKNNHRALLLQISATEVIVTARGFKPENTLFLVHEVFETLIADSYSGVSYDFSLPCLECMSEFILEPCMFTASKVKRALDMKAPFLQCDQNFHIVSIPEIQAVMPPASSADFDEHLGRSVRELHDLGGEVMAKVHLIYSRRNVPDLTNEGKVMNPLQILEDLRGAGYNVSYCDDPETTNQESQTMVIKAAQAVVFCISDEYVESEQARNLIIYTKQTLRKNILLIAIGKTLNWMKTDINLILADEVFVKLTQPERYPSKFKELLEHIQFRCSKKKIEYPECFISYAWANSKTAVELGSATVEGALGWGDPRKIKEFLQSHGVNCWLDVEQMGQEGFFEDLADGLRKAKVMVAFVSDEYAKSKNCRMEFRFAVSTLRIPIVLAVVGTGYEWERSEIGLLTVGHSQSCPKVNFQYENEAGLMDILKEVQRFLPKSVASSDEPSGGTIDNAQAVAFQEVLELSQRKFLRHITTYADGPDYPRLVLIDFKSQDQPPQSSQSSEDKEAKEATEKKEETQSEDVESERKAVVEEMATDAEGVEKSNKYCFRLLCEHEQGWHESPLAVDFPHKEGAALDEFLKDSSPYLARIHAILKHTKINLGILNTPQGERMRRKMEEWCPRANPDFHSEYGMLVDTVSEMDPNLTYGGLKRCHMPNGKVLWLCEQHEGSSFTQTKEKYKDQLQINPAAEDKGLEIEPEKPTVERSQQVEVSQAAPAAASSNVVTDPRPDTGESSATSSKSPEGQQKAVKLSKTAGAQQLPPRRPKLSQRSMSGKKTSSQACRLM
ncbi:uncharacterized protein LOC101848126 [Aplysia californica]|uniref:non-specific serine/threonine protein kinase n=1 Tax=Aplysia californica TaxID=6500 RepID=A0ABM1VWA6_APLCA|nr:uncharacterized protein LOC101848126 [Aplysia californica]